MASRDVSELASVVGHHFNDISLLLRSVTHRSWCAEHPGAVSNERLEFLGDAVLGWAVADLAYRRFASLAEGQMTDLRKAVVNAEALAVMARQMDLGSFLLLGRGEDAAGGRDKASILSDALEATIGAVYVDGGTEAAVDYVRCLVTDAVDVAVTRLDRLDHKTRLQELVAQRTTDTLVYDVLVEGPDHDRWFSATVTLGGRVLGTGEGTSKKRAEQAAAQEACLSVDTPES